MQFNSLLLPRENHKKFQLENSIFSSNSLIASTRMILLFALFRYDFFFSLQPRNELFLRQQQWIIILESIVLIMQANSLKNSFQQFYISFLLDSLVPLFRNKKIFITSRLNSRPGKTVIYLDLNFFFYFLLIDTGFIMYCALILWKHHVQVQFEDHVCIHTRSLN